MPDLRGANPAGGLLAVPMRVHLPGASPAVLPDLRFVSRDGPLLPVRRNGEVAWVRFTLRDRDLVFRLGAARWLSTSQVGRLCFPEVSPRVLQRRLRLLREAGFLTTAQAHPMAEGLHTVGPKGKDLLLDGGWEQPIRLEREPPRNLEHFLGINDVRIAVERSGGGEGIHIRFFYACWELQQRGWRWSVVPDAALSAERSECVRTVAFEYDRGFEGPGFIVRTKFRRYALGFEGFPLSQVITVAETDRRRSRLQEYTVSQLGEDRGMFTFLTLEELRTVWSVRALFPDLDAGPDVACRS
jgi:hypothetical protein